MQFIRNHKKESIILLVVLSLFVISSVTFGKYIYNILDVYILQTKDFYFSSNVLSVNNKKHKINNWDGVNGYTLTIDLNNKKNSFKSTKSDIKYNISVICNDDVSCTLNKTSSIIKMNQNTDSYQIYINPSRVFNPGEIIKIDTKVESTYPYKLTLSATYYIEVSEKDFVYKIVDHPGNNFFTLNLTNSLTYYKVERAFGNYNVGDVIGLDVFNSLSDNNKKNCYSSIVTLSFDPSLVYLDMTNNSYLNAINGSVTKKKIRGHDYVNKYSFKMNATSNEKIYFYKSIRSGDYTYPDVNNKSIIKVDVKLAK